MQKKEHYRGSLPHFQQPGQWYFITIILYNAMPKIALKDYSEKMVQAYNRYNFLKENNPNSLVMKKTKNEYFSIREKYRIILDKYLDNLHETKNILSDEKNRIIMEEALKFWEGKKLTTHAWCIMPNHFHWVVSLFKNDTDGIPVYLQDILHSVKLFSARRINENEKRKGQLWHHESFETTIRNDRHLMNAVNYTINNPVVAGLVSDFRDWPGTYIEPELIRLTFSGL